MKKITHETPYDEIVQAALEARKNIDTALVHLSVLNLALVREWLGSAKIFLPEDTGEGGIVWAFWEAKP